MGFVRAYESSKLPMMVQQLESAGGREGGGRTEWDQLPLACPATACLVLSTA
jgi:hypothetical protein